MFSTLPNNPRLNFVNPGLRYQTVRGAGNRANPPIGLITGIPASVYSKFVYGAGVGASNIFSRRANLRRAMTCGGKCGRFIYPLDQPNYNVNGRVQ